MIHTAQKQDARTLAELATQMWDSGDIDGLAREFAEMIDSGRAACFIAHEGGEAVGFAQCQLRTDYVEGTSTSPVGYLEGIFVKEEQRGKGHARALLAACEAWAKAQGCTEFASDCELVNLGSYAFHMAMGFEEANRVVCFTKKI